MSSRRAIFGSIAVSIAFVMELTLVPLFLPTIQEQFGLTIGQLAWVFNSYGISVAIGVLIGGWLGDMFSTNRVFGVGVLFFATGSAIVAFAPSYDVMLVGRILQGLGGGIFSPLVPILLTTASPERPGRVLIVWGSIAGYVAALAPLIYSSILSTYGWNLAFMLFAIVSIAALAIVHRSHVGSEPPTSKNTLSDYARLFASHELWVMFGYVFCTYGAITYYLFRLPLRLAESDVQVASIGVALSIMWLSFSVVSTLLRNAVDAPHIRGILLAGPVLIASGFTLSYFSQDIALLVLSSIFVGAGLACSNAPSTQLIIRFAPTGLTAASVSLDITFARLGGVASVAILSQSLFGYTVLAVIVMSAIAFGLALVASSGLAEAGEP